MKTVYNLCPHPITVVLENGETIEYPPSGTIARVEETPGVELKGLPFPARTASTYGKITGLQPFVLDDTIYIVSGMVAAAILATGPRSDVFCPGDAVRDETGRVIGVKNLKAACY